MTITQEQIDALRAIERTEMKAGGLFRVVWIHEEFDCWDGCHFDQDTCRPGLGGWHGIAAREITWGVGVRGRGAASFSLYTPIYTQRAVEQMKRRRRAAGEPPWADDWEPLGPVAVHLAQEPADPSWYGKCDDCQLVGGPCWGGSTYLQAGLGWETFLAGGTPAVWTWLGEAWLPSALAGADR